MGDQADGPATELLLRFARVAHDAGYPTADLEERLLALADALGLTGVQVSATPTIVELALGSLPYQRSYTIRVRPPTVDLAAIARLDDLVQHVVDAQLGAVEALAELAELEASPLERPWPVLLAASTGHMAQARRLIPAEQCSLPRWTTWGT